MLGTVNASRSTTPICIGQAYGRGRAILSTGERPCFCCPPSPKQWLTKAVGARCGLTGYAVGCAAAGFYISGEMTAFHADAEGGAGAGYAFKADFAVLHFGKFLA